MKPFVCIKKIPKKLTGSPPSPHPTVATALLFYHLNIKMVEKVTRNIIFHLWK